MRVAQSHLRRRLPVLLIGNADLGLILSLIRAGSLSRSNESNSRAAETVSNGNKGSLLVKVPRVEP